MIQACRESAHSASVEPKEAFGLVEGDETSAEQSASPSRKRAPANTEIKPVGPKKFIGSGLGPARTWCGTCASGGAGEQTHRELDPRDDSYWEGLMWDGTVDGADHVLPPN